MKKIIFLTRDKKFFGQTRKPWVSAKYEKITKYLKEHGYEVVNYSYHEIMNLNIEIGECPIFYTFSQKKNYRHYFKDIISLLATQGCDLIPEIDLLLCHENKGYQEIVKKKKGINSLNSLYFASRDDLAEYKIDYPVVFKTIDGSNGTGVRLVKNAKDLDSIIKQYEKLTFSEKVDLFRRMYFRHKTFKEYPDYSDRDDCQMYRKHILPERAFILQPFVPKLKYDYRVLVLYNHVWVTRRWNREDDFRASGAKKFDCNFEVDPKLLDFGMSIFKKFNTPSLSIDVAYDGKEFYLIEYQAQHFGINVIMKNKGYYYQDGSKWRFKEIKPNFEREIGNCLVEYLDNYYVKK